MRTRRVVQTRRHDEPVRQGQACPANGEAVYLPRSVRVSSRPGHPQPQAKDPVADHPRPDGRNIPEWPEIRVPKRSLLGSRDSTTVPGSEKRPRRRTARARRDVAAPGKLGSTNPAVGDSAEYVLHLTRSRFGIDGGNRRQSAQCAIRALQPAHSQLMIPQTLTRQRDNARQPVKAVRLKSRQPSAAPPPLQAARREVKGLRQFFQREPRSLHQFLDHRRREPFANRIPQIAVIGERPPESLVPSQLFHYGLQFCRHLSPILATNVACVNLMPCGYG